jgi:hypothetical protein
MGSRLEDILYCKLRPKHIFFPSTQVHYILQHPPTLTKISIFYMLTRTYYTVQYINWLLFSGVDGIMKYCSVHYTGYGCVHKIYGHATLTLFWRRSLKFSKAGYIALPTPRIQ